MKEYKLNNKIIKNFLFIIFIIFNSIGALENKEFNLDNPLVNAPQDIINNIIFQLLESYYKKTTNSKSLNSDEALKFANDFKNLRLTSKKLDKKLKFIINETKTFLKAQTPTHRQLLTFPTHPFFLILTTHEFLKENLPVNKILENIRSLTDLKIELDMEKLIELEKISNRYPYSILKIKKAIEKDLNDIKTCYWHDHIILKDTNDKDIKALISHKRFYKKIILRKCEKLFKTTPYKASCFNWMMEVFSKHEFFSEWDIINIASGSQNQAFQKAILDYHIKERQKLALICSIMIFLVYIYNSSNQF